MINVIQCELNKLKKSYILLVVIAGGVFPGLFLFIGNASAGIRQSVDGYFSNATNIMCLFIGLFLSAMISSFIVSREFSDKTINILFTYPISKIQIMIAKIMVIFILLFITYIIHLGTTFLTALIILDEPITSSFTRSTLIMYGKSLLFQFALVPLFFLVASVTKNMIVTIVLGAFSAITNPFILGMEYEKAIYSPFVAPTLMFVYNKIAIETIAVSSALFIIGLISCIVYFNRADIN